MKHRILSILLIPLLGLSSCATTGGSQDLVTLVAPVSTIAVSGLLSKGNPSEQQAKARQIVLIADAIDLLSDPATTGADVSRTVSLYGANKPEFVAVGAALGMIYDRYVTRVGQSRAMEVLAQISLGVRVAATPYLQ